jgi:glycerol-3-phosphate acyltransferase PlsY
MSLPVTLTLSAAASSYLIGAIPFAYIVARLYGVDIRKVGSGNVGATNVLRSVGKVAGVTVLLLDVAKGLLPTFLIPYAFTACTQGEQSTPLAITCALAAICGHVWPIYLRFKGGKGIATSAGALIALAPAAVLIGLIVWIIVLLVSKYVSLASITAAVAIPAVSWYLYSPEGMLLPCALTVIGILAVAKHKSNIQRLIKGNENRITLRKKPNE